MISRHPQFLLFMSGENEAIYVITQLGANYFLQRDRNGERSVFYTKIIDTRNDEENRILEDQCNWIKEAINIYAN